MSTSSSFTSFGSYGCTYYPSFDCNGKKSKQSSYISKISLIDFYSTNEYKVSKHLKSLYENYDFIKIVEKRCLIKKKNIKNIKKHNKKCKIYDKKDKNDYVILYSKYIKSYTFKEYLLKDIGVSYIKLLYYYNFILACIDFLQAYNVIHNDLHFSNTLFDTDKKKLYLIDFGLSIYNLKKKFDDPNYDIYYYLKKMFVKFDPEWKYHPIELHICCYLLYESDNISDTKLKEIIDIYFLSTKDVFGLLFNNLVTYKDKVFFHYKELLSGKNAGEIIKSLLLDCMFTLDLYQTAYCILNCIIKYDIEFSTSFLELLKSSLHYDYKKRPSVKKLKKKFALISKSVVESESKIKKDIFDKESIVSKKELQM